MENVFLAMPMACGSSLPGALRFWKPNRSRGEPGFDEIGSPAPVEFAYNRLMEFNRRLRSYGSPDWDGKIVPENHGPALGRSKACTDCHDGKSRGILTVSTSKTQLEKKIYYELSMPYDTELQPLLERKADEESPADT